MLNETIVNILVDRIRNSGINPVTGQSMVLDDIKIAEYKSEVEALIEGSA